MSKKRKAVLFDLDGTLIDTYNLILASFQYATKMVLGKTIPDDELMKKVGQPLSTQMWDWTGDQDVHDELLRVYREFNHAAHDANVRSFEGMGALLASLKEKGLLLGVVTSTLHWLANRGLEVCGLDQYMNILIAPDDFPDAHKPDPGPVLYAVEQLGLSPDECWYVGDSPFDIAAGNAAGCATAAVTWGMFTEGQLQKENPTVMCTTMGQLSKALMESLG